MTEHTQAQLLTVKCPKCDAPTGELCTGRLGVVRETMHTDRKVEYELEQARRRHPAVANPTATHTIVDGRVAFPLDDQTRITGLEAIARLREEYPNLRRPESKP